VISALLDTDTLIAMLRGDTGIARKVRAQPAKSLAVSSVTLYELLVGLEKSANPAKNRRLMDDALAPFTIANFDEPAGLEAAKIRAILEKKGTGIGPYDTLIAGHALSLEAKLVTANTREFRRVAGLKIENWLA
jgi:tRNA(fMet)-specific endonuclease VapC